MAPEYASTGRYSVKSDVYSYGVVTLEIIRGEKNITFRYGENGASLVNYVSYSLSLSQTHTHNDTSIQQGWRALCLFNLKKKIIYLCLILHAGLGKMGG